MTASVVIGNLIYLVGAGVLASIGGIIVVRRYRKPASVEANMATFNRGLRALAPGSAANADDVETRSLPAPAVGPEITERVKVLGADPRGVRRTAPPGQDTEAQAG